MTEAIYSGRRWPRFRSLADDIVDIAGDYAARGMLPATSGNFSARLGDDVVAITQSGKDKGHLQISDIMVADLSGTAVYPAEAKPSAETLIHIYIYRVLPKVQYVAHSHSLAAATVSYQESKKGKVSLPPFELLKALEGTKTHEAEVELQVFENDQDIPRLVSEIESRFENTPPAYGFLLAGHGLYTWGDSKEQVLRHGEALEFLLNAKMYMDRP